MVEQLPTVVALGHGVLVKVDPLFCTSVACPPIVHGIIVNYDLRHVTMHYSRFVAIVLGQLISSSGVNLAG
jgi:hypothetical protein